MREKESDKTPRFNAARCDQRRLCSPLGSIDVGMQLHEQSRHPDDARAGSVEVLVDPVREHLQQVLARVEQWRLASFVPYITRGSQSDNFIRKISGSRREVEVTAPVLARLGNIPKCARTYPIVHSNLEALSHEGSLTKLIRFML
jgi:hypothetical protein